MAATPATLFGTQMTALLGNSGGAVQNLPKDTLTDGDEGSFIENITLAAQVSGSVFAVARVPLNCILLGIEVCTDTSLGSSTLAFGDAADTKGAIYGAAKTLTATDTPTQWAKTATYGAEITTGVDCLTGAVVSPLAPGQGGAAYEDIIMTVGAATLPASGNVVVRTKFKKIH